MNQPVDLGDPEPEQIKVKVEKWKFYPLDVDENSAPTLRNFMKFFQEGATRSRAPGAIMKAQYSRQRASAILAEVVVGAMTESGFGSLREAFIAVYDKTIPVDHDHPTMQRIIKGTVKILRRKSSVDGLTF